MRPPESSSRSSAALACSSGERVKAFAIAVPMRTRARRLRDRGQRHVAVPVEELDRVDAVEAGGLGALGELDVAPHAARR